MEWYRTVSNVMMATPTQNIVNMDSRLVRSAPQPVKRGTVWCLVFVGMAYSKKRRSAMMATKIRRTLAYPAVFLLAVETDLFKWLKRNVMKVTETAMKSLIVVVRAVSHPDAGMESKIRVRTVMMATKTLSGVLMERRSVSSAMPTVKR